ncbi:hypothetical protein TNCV_4972681 [Trichonephila clavipes]|nr:hypothetical protein TNCV_4972681 [Trichonephila clavipes]
MPTHELAPLLTSTPTGGSLSFDRFNLHRPSIQRLFSGTRLELMIRRERVRYHIMTTRLPQPQHHQRMLYKNQIAIPTVSLEIICHNCGESTSPMSSKISNKCYDVNLRLTYGIRAIGKGGAAARIFYGLMNLPPPPAKFERHNSLFLNVLKTISEDSRMQLITKQS